MSNPGRNEILEPSGISPNSILNICGVKNQKKPKIGDFPKASGALSAVKNFLPKLKKAEEELQKQIEEGKNVNVEDFDEHDKHIEMNVELFQQNRETWSEDSEPDSPPSPPERDNAFTSDSSSSSTDSVSSSSSSEGLRRKDR